MIAELTNHLWQSTVCAAAAALLALGFRRNRAEVRYWFWTCASIKFLLPFSLLVAAGSWVASLVPVQRAPGVDGVMPAVSMAVEQFAQPFSDGPVLTSPAAAPAAMVNWLAVAYGLWAAGFLTIAFIRVTGWRRVRAAIRASAPVTLAAIDPPVAVRSTPGLLEPGVVGWWRPVLLVPAGIENQLSPSQLRAVIAHELSHVQRGDNLTATVHMFVEALFWFHPIVWWIGARLIAERERACDEAVLRAGIEPVEYASGIVTICKQYVESPLRCVSGVTGADLKHRIRAILSGRESRDLGYAKKMVLIAALIVVVAAPVTFGMIARPQAPASERPAASTFEVASVRPCERLPARGGAPGKIDVSTNRTYLECFTLARLVNVAYAKNGDFTLNADEVDRNVRNGPDWVRSDLFTIEAKAAGAADQSVMLGTMLRALLEERFKLRARVEVEQVPMYSLTVAGGGLKLTPAVDGDCLPDESQDTAAQTSGTAKKPPCGMKAGRRRGAVRTWELTGASLRELADVLDTDRPVLDQTAVTGRFNIRLEYALDDSVLDAPTLPQALGKLGLRLTSTKGPHQYVVIDHAERPSFAPASAGASEGKPVSAGAKEGTQKFEVASIRPCENTPSVPGGRNGGVGPVFSPGMFVYNCGTLEQLINGAYVTNGDPLLNDEGRGTPRGTRDPRTFPDRIRGGPDWVRSDRFMIEAKTSASSGRSGREAIPERAILMGPMLRALLEDRFKLKLHREVLGDVPMYALTIAKGGLKIKPAGADSCAPSDPSRTAPYQMNEEIETVRKGGKPICGHGIMGGPVGPNHAVVLNGQTMDGVARWLSNVMDRHVLDQTGVSDTFVIFMEYAPDDLVPYDFKTESPDQPTAPSITQVLKSLGLELQPTKGPKGYIVIDHAEHPSSAPASAGAKEGGR
ncbi:MAG TPA: M56 family metallopeptidase [Vicinamibacterales bacterium]|nr:M56 family metallopeptidase [Vicinamibacterales bacterium]